MVDSMSRCDRSSAITRRASDCGSESSGVTRAPVLPDPISALAASGDPGALVAALVARSAQANRSIQDQARRSQDATQDAEEKAHVAQLHHQADAIRNGALVSGVCTMASSVLELGSSTSASNAKGRTGGERVQAENCGHRLKAEAQAFDIAGKLGAGYQRAAETRASARATDAEHHANRAGRTSKDAGELIADATRLIERAFEFLKEYNATKHQTIMAATHRA